MYHHKTPIKPWCEDELPLPSMEEASEAVLPAGKEAVVAGSTAHLPGAVNSMGDLAETQKLMDFLGYNPGAGKSSFDELQSKMDAAREQMEADYTNSKWMALAQMGAGMASSRNPDFAGAFGEGVEGGIASLTEAKKGKRRQETLFLGMEADMVNAREAARKGDVDTAAGIYSTVIDKRQGDQALALKGAALAQKSGTSSMDRLEFFYETLNDQLKSIDRVLSGDAFAGIPPLEGEDRNEKIIERDAVLEQFNAVREQLFGPAGRVELNSGGSGSTNPFRAAMTGGN